MSDLHDALATIGAAIPQEARDAHLHERRLNLAASGTALAVDLGVAGLSDEQRAATEAQVVAIAEEIQRLSGLSSIPVDEYPQTASMSERLGQLEEGLALIAGELLGGAA